MKKLIFLLLTIFSVTCFGQMSETRYVGEPYNYVTYTNPCNELWVIIQPGHGAAGYSIETLSNVGYGKYAKTRILPFNVLIVQAKKGTYSWLDDYVPVKKNWSTVFTKLGITKAVLTGYSLGGKETIRQIWTDKTGVFVGFVAMCGDFPWGSEPELKVDSLACPKPVFLLHGTADTQVGYSQSIFVAKKLNAVHPGQATLVLIEGASHNVWDRGYNPDNEYGKQIYAFILNCDR